ncbi:MAG TPA: purine-nucleoside phosphorylase [Anaerolinea thermolimosa]|uniref:Purine nucleoside phosphorylase n=1 Tax=Anaerolinea thermolimosa TaxID=229919 RepID=A0A3D1JF42_9CHLR|nr:purine-nucleoside phosphorylase [Anaerolinea thermolimosa]GAP05674.1 purine nucleoside phosphorylase I, inosine and guanosine-specific [Anaerolinea thermolimosa]HCE16378.1 purine-nucleoside phosphorylase [Anaerolinea thermolimosa]
MREYLTLAEIDQAAQAVRNRIDFQPRVGLVLGSGLGGLAEKISNAVAVPYESIPYWPQSTVPGHVGRLVAGSLFGVPVLVQQGRAHFYEGYSMAEVTLPVRVMKRLGIDILILTNAAGAIHPAFEPGDVMLITDHISLVGMTGFNPLRGPNLDELGPRFPDMSQVYDRALAELARRGAAEEHIVLREGVYCGLSGPSFETPADLRFLRTIGADAVGMSTVPEAIVARHANMRVLGLSGISNKANLDGNTLTTHEEVLAAGKVIVPKLERIIERVLRGL